MCEMCGIENNNSLVFERNYTRTSAVINSANLKRMLFDYEINLIFSQAYRTWRNVNFSHNRFVSH